MNSLPSIDDRIKPSEYEQFLFHEGKLFRSYSTFGSHFDVLNGVKGVRFTVWAPQAEAVSVVGDFNEWNGDGHRMSKVPDSGIWVCFVPGLESGALYKYEITDREGRSFLKADPFAFLSEKRPNTASVVYSLDDYDWRDSSWMTRKGADDHFHQPMLVYEIHAGSWKKHDDGSFYSYRQLADELIDYVADLGYTHIELMPIMEHPYDRSWGYQVTGYYSATSRFGKPEDLMYFVDCCHQKGIGVILDWVPVHFCKDAHGLARFDGTCLYEPEDSRYAERGNWGTLNFDFAKPEIHSFLVSNAFFWMDKYHVDGFRLDAVSSMIYLNHDRPAGETLHNEYGGEENLQAVEFLKTLNSALFRHYPNALMMAEEATDWPLVSAPVSDGGLGFNYKWNMGWVHDILRYMRLDVSERHAHHQLITFSMFYAFSENFVLPFSHDEVVYGKRSLLHKMPGDDWQKFANLRLLYSYWLTHPGKKLMFMGGELAQFDEWKDETQLDWQLLQFDTHRNFHRFSGEWNRWYRDTRALWRLDHEPEGFEWIDPHNHSQSIIIFMRKGKHRGDYCIVVCNFSTEVYHGYRIGVPTYGKYYEAANSDATAFGGSGQTNDGVLQAEKLPYHNQRYSMEITVPPLAAAVFMKQTKNRRRR
ncbi:MAG TPA: 1,4-alpha-glucan branching protein GlgB [Bacillales bacterium]|nr:1,4-alpha-glucan branching protein GlgB [Bacillales bacterium]